jgi:hypothetical protein
VAVNVLDAADLGIYAVFFSAFTFGQLVAYQLIYVPAEIVAVSRRGVFRLAIFDDSFRLGSLPSLAGASLAFLAALTTAPLASTQLTIALTATAFTATLLSPSQDHVRRTLHIADKSWQAAAMSFRCVRRLDPVRCAYRCQLPFSPLGPDLCREGPPPREI